MALVSCGRKRQNIVNRSNVRNKTRVQALYLTMRLGQLISIFGVPYSNSRMVSTIQRPGIWFYCLLDRNDTNRSYQSTISIVIPSSFRLMQQVHSQCTSLLPGLSIIVSQTELKGWRRSSALGYLYVRLSRGTENEVIL